jgi:phosphatidylglycerophosphatase A
MEKLATMFGIGNAKFMPGTLGSLAAALLAYPILKLPMGWIAIAAGVAILTILGTKAARVYMNKHEHMHDPSAIVVDEWAGQWLTFTTWHAWLLFIAGSPAASFDLLNEIAASPLHLFYGFILFRFFDILKPWPIRWADRKIKTPFGVIFDDLLAGIAAGTILFGIYLIGPYISGTMMESHA